MADLNINFQNEQGTNLNRYIITNVVTGEETIVDLARDGTITQQGTPLDANTMNAIKTAINSKVDKVEGYTLTKNDFTDALKNKLDGIESGAEVNVQPDYNQADTSADDYIKNKPDLTLKEDKSNKVTSWGSTPSNDKYPSEKLVKDTIDALNNEGSVDVSDNNLYKISGKSDSLALPPLSQVEIKEKRGNSVVVNQYAKELNSSNWSGSDTTFNNDVMTFSPNGQWSAVMQQTTLVSGHKYLLTFSAKSSNYTGNISYFIGDSSNVGSEGVYGSLSPNISSSWEEFITIGTYTQVGSPQVIGFMQFSQTNDCVVDIKNVRLIDLTQWFGSNDNIPTDILTTPSNFFKYYKGSLAFDTGHIENGSGNLVDTNRNIWDEEWEVGDISRTTGENAATTGEIRSKNYIRVVPNSQYFVKTTLTNHIRILCYDINKNYIYIGVDGLLGDFKNETFVIPSNCVYIRLITRNTYGATYNHDICINVSDPNFNGTYVAHVENTLDFGNDTLRSAGNVRDSKKPSNEITRKIGYKDLATLNWTKVEQGNIAYYYTDISDIKRASNNSIICNIICSNYITNNISQTIQSQSIPYICSDDTNSRLLVSYFPLGNNTPTGIVHYELATPTTEQSTPYDNHLPVYYGGQEFTTGDVPFVINKNYDISIKDQVITNVRVDKEQSEQIHALENADKSLQEQIDNIEEEFNESSVDTTDTKIIKVSGIDDNLAIPEESQVEINKVVCGALVDNNVIPTANKNGSITVPSGASYYDITIYNNLGLAITEGHVILAFAKITRTLSSNNFIGVCFWNNNNANIPITLTLNSNDNDGVVYNIKKIPTGSSVLKSISFNNYNGKCGFNTGDTMSYSDLNWCDLTIRYGSTIAEYLASLSLDNALAWLRANDPNIFKYREYGNALVNTNGDLITTNRNVWDEEWEVGRYNVSTGEKDDSVSDRIRCKNFIKVIPNATYYIRVPSNITAGNVNIFYYDANKNFIEFHSSSSNPKTIPSNACYMTFYLDNNYGTTYNHDICINVSDTSFNGQYVSHKQETQTLPSGYGIPKLVDNKLSFDGDEIIGDKFDSKYDIVDLGSLNWSYMGDNAFICGGSVWADGLDILCTKYRADVIGDKRIRIVNGNIIIVDSSYTDATTFKNAMLGVMLVYEKAQPTQSTITPIHPMSCYKGGYELQNSDVPYTLTRNYDISIKDQVKTNVEVDREQSNIIKEMKDKLDLIDPSQYVTAVDDSIIPNSPNPVQSKVIQANFVAKDGNKVLSDNNFTNTLKDKLDGIEAQANKTVVDSSLSSSSTNPVQNKVVKGALDNKVDKVTGKGLSTNDFINAYKSKVDFETNWVNYVKVIPFYTNDYIIQSGEAYFYIDELIKVSNTSEYNMKIEITGLKNPSGKTTYYVNAGVTDYEYYESYQNFYLRKNPTDWDAFSYNVSIKITFTKSTSSIVGTQYFDSIEYYANNNATETIVKEYTMTVFGTYHDPR